jgi:ankyrin repeat protein
MISHLYAAISSNNTEKVKTLLNNDQIDPNSILSGQTTPLQLAILAGNTEIIKLFLECPRVDVNFSHEKQTPPLHLVLQTNQPNEIIELMLTKKADPNIKNQYGYTPLHLTKNPSVIKMLLDAGADPNTLNKDKKSPLHYAIETVDNAALEALLSSEKTNPNLKVEGEPILFKCIRAKNKKAVEIFLKNKKIDPTIRNNYGDNPLHIAASMGKNVDMIKALLETKINLNEVDRDGQTPLSIALSINGSGDKANIDILLAKIFSESKLLRASILTACQYGHLNVIKLIFNEMMNRLKRTSFLQIALSTAVQYNQLSIVKFLVNEKKMLLNNQQGCDLLRTAIIKNYSGIAKFLQEKGSFLPNDNNQLIFRSSEKEKSLLPNIQNPTQNKLK